jgi:hypothetical protein
MPACPPDPLRERAAARKSALLPVFPGAVAPACGNRGRERWGRVMSARCAQAPAVTSAGTRHGDRSRSLAAL